MSPTTLLLAIGSVIAIGSAACGGSPTQADGTVKITQATVPPPPTPQLAAGAISASPTGIGIASATLYTFAFATQPSGGVTPYTVSWDFGDGAAGSGMSPAHIYASTGNFTTTVTVTDSKGTTATASAPVSIRSVTGNWTTKFDTGPRIPQVIDLVQNLNAVTASINGTADGSALGMGSVSNPRSLSVTVTFGAGTPGTYNATFIGTLNDTLLTWSGTATGYLGCPCAFTATRPSAGQ